MHPDDETLRLNTLPFTVDTATDARELALRRLVERTPAFPLDAAGSLQLRNDLERELPALRISAALDGSLVQEPSVPNQGEFLEVVDQAAIFVAAKSSYFLTSDLDNISETEADAASATALGSLLTGGGAQP